MLQHYDSLDDDLEMMLFVESLAKHFYAYDFLYDNVVEDHWFLAIWFGWCIIAECAYNSGWLDALDKVKSFGLDALWLVVACQLYAEFLIRLCHWNTIVFYCG